MAEASRRSELGRARGLGSAKEGVAHWWAQRLTALALVPLLLWFVASLVATCAIAWLAVGMQTFRAARLRPADVLKHE